LTDGNPGIQFVAIGVNLANNLAWYQDQRATDGYFSTAILRSSTDKWNQYIGYKPKAATPCSITLDMEISSSPSVLGFSVPIPKGFRLYGTNDTIFELLSEVKYVGSDIQKSLTFVEGETVTDTFVSNNEANQIFSLRSLYLVFLQMNGKDYFYHNNHKKSMGHTLM